MIPCRSYRRGARNAVDRWRLRERRASGKQGLFGGQQGIAIGAEGETDELGVPYPQPLLKGLITAGKVAYFNADLGMSGHDPETIRQFDDLLNASLRLFPRNVRTPKNGPVPDHGVNGYGPQRPAY